MAISFQGYQGEVKPQVGHEIPGEEEGAQMMQLSQIQLVQIVTNAVNQTPTQHMQQTGSNPPQAAAASTPVVLQIQSPTKFEIPAFEGDSATS